VGEATVRAARRRFAYLKEAERANSHLDHGDEDTTYRTRGRGLTAIHLPVEETVDGLLEAVEAVRRATRQGRRRRDPRNATTIFVAAICAQNCSSTRTPRSRTRSMAAIAGGGGGGGPGVVTDAAAALARSRPGMDRSRLRLR